MRTDSHNRKHRKQFQDGSVRFCDHGHREGEKSRHQGSENAKPCEICLHRKTAVRRRSNRKKHEIGPLPIIKKLLELPYVFEIVPIGSKGVQYEWKKLCEENKLDYCQITSTEIDITKSAGPATCFLISFHPDRTEDIAKAAGGHFFQLNTK